ncbi:hypothetical protein [Limnohabitans radicicola]|uniref:Uncharacterized protein n=1 Tax=Limnohabitans radicicola TaxID=2771427 RepID=A0A927IMF4_9BURK|nr:hypothetical protein [Limnohabitans radicicola]MBD8051125.1 hypothetical protein [Limnohabitans radicicola]
MNQPVDLIDALEREPELALLVAQPPIAFHRSFVDITGSAMAALLLSSYLEQQESQPLTLDGWFEVDGADLQYRSGLADKERQMAHKTLLSQSLVRDRRGKTGRRELKIDFDRISHAILAAARQRSVRSQIPNDQVNPLTLAH